MEPKTYILDRWEENWAVLEQADGSLLNIPRQELPPGSREGDVLQKTEESWQRLPEARQAREEALRRRLNKLWKEN